MKEALKENKKIIGMVVGIAILILVIIGSLLWWMDYKKKEYHVEEVTSFQYYTLNKEGKIGVIDLKGSILIEPIYDSIKIPNPEKAVFICQTGEEIKVLNEKGEAIFTDYEEVTAIEVKGIVTKMPYEKSALKYKQDGKYGLINLEGKKMTKPVYDSIGGLINKESELLVEQNGKFGVINSKGATIIKPQYENITGDGFYTAEEKYKLSGYIVTVKTQEGYRYGYNNNKLKTILAPEYTQVYRIIETEETKDVYIIAAKNGQVGVVKNNEVIINYGYQDIEYDEYNKLFKLQKGSKYGVADITGKQIVAVEYDEIDFNAMYISGTKQENEVLFDTKGNQVKEVKYTSLLQTTNEEFCVVVGTNGKYGVVNKQKEEVIPNEYYYIEYVFDDYFIATKQEGDLGIINSKNEVIVDFQYDVLQKIDNKNMVEAKILKDGKTDLYSKELKKVATMNNATIYLEEEYVQMYSQNEVKYFDIDGNEVKNTQIFSKNTLFASKKEDKWGFVDQQGNVIVKYQYDKVTEFNVYGFAGVYQDGKWGVVNNKGEIMLEPTYPFQEGTAEPEFIGKYYRVYYGYGESYYTDRINK